MRLPRLGGPALASLVTRGAGMAGAFAMSVAILRSLPDQDAGLVVLVYTLLTIAATIARFGCDNLALREVSRDPSRSGDLVRHSWGLCLLLSPLAATLLVVAILLQGSQQDVGSIAVAAALAVSPAALSIVAGAVLRGLGRVALGTLAELGSPVLIAAAGIAILGLTGTATSARATWMLCLAYVVTAVWSWAAIARSMPGVVGRPRGTLGFLRRHRNSLASFFTTTMGFFLFAWLPVLALGYFIDNRSDAHTNVAIFNAGARLSQFVALIPTIQISYLSQRFANLHHRGEISQLNRLSQRSTRTALLGAVPLTALLLLQPHLALSVFGGYSAAAPTLRVLAVGALAVASLGPVNGLLLTCGHERAAGRMTFVLVLVSAAVLPVIADWGSAVVAVGSSIASVAYAIAGYLVLGRDGIHPVDLLVRRRVKARATTES